MTAPADGAEITRRALSVASRESDSVRWAPEQAERLGSFAAAWVVALSAIGLFVTMLPAGFLPEVRAYWAAWQGGLYASMPTLDQVDYIYAPPFAQAIAPLALLPWPAFAALWAGLAWAALWWMLLPVRLAPRIPLFVIFLTVAGNAAVFVALAIASRRAAAWAFVLLTKVTPGVGLLWYVVRREWRGLLVACGATLAVTTLSFALAPDLWFQWTSVILADSGHHGGIVTPLLPQVPLAVRVAGAGLLVAWGARNDRAWVLAVAALFANTDLLASSLPLLAAVPRLGRPRS